MLNGYIYLIHNKITKKKYIGQTNNFKDRFKKHIRYAKAVRAKSILHNSIRKHGIDNFEYSLLIDVKAKNEKWLRYKLNKLEIYFIRQYSSLIPNGYNMTKGGKGAVGLSGKFHHLYGKHLSETTRNKISEANKKIKGTDHHWYGKKHKEETKLKIGNAQKGIFNHMFGKKSSLESRKKMSISRMGSKNYKAKKILQFDFNGNLIKEWDCVMDVIRNLNFSNNISACARGEIKKSHGFVWRYK